MASRPAWELPPHELREIAKAAKIPEYRPYDAVPVLARGLEVIARDIPFDAYASIPRSAMRAALQMMTELGIEPSLASDWRACLLSLALGDTWLRVGLDERQGLRNMLKLIAIDETKAGDLLTRSALVKEQSRKGLQIGQMFDPEARDGNPFADYIIALEAYIERFRDDDMTQEVRELMADWGSGSILHDVRGRLDITPENEKPTDVVVLGTERIAACGYSEVVGQFLPPGDTRLHPLIVLARMNRSMLNIILPHEYRHAEAHSLFMAYYLIFSGLAEGLADDSSGGATVYDVEREVLWALLKDDPNLGKLLNEADFGDESAKQTAFLRLIQLYGLPGFLDIARMIPHEYAPRLQPLYAAFRVPPYQVLQNIKQHRYDYMRNYSKN
jgi:hypothetical protein